MSERVSVSTPLGPIVESAALQASLDPNETEGVTAQIVDGELELTLEGRPLTAAEGAPDAD